MKGENYKASKDSELSRCSTSAASLASQSSSQQDEVERNDQSISGSNRLVYWQLLILAATSIASFSASIIILLPFPVLVALSLSLSSFFGMIYLIVLLFYDKWDEIIQGNGIGDYLPTSVYNLLTESTLHEWLQDTSFTLEYRHLLLYFIPGITEQQLEAYIDGLSPRHRYNLRRHGLGHFFGENIMRLIMGDSRYHRNLLLSQQRPTELVIPPPELMVSGRDTTDISSINHELMSSSRNERPDPQHDTEVIEETNIVSRAILSPVDGSGEADNEGNVLSAALTSAARSLATTSVQTISMGVIQVADIISQRTVSAGMAVTIISTGAAFFGMWLDASPSSVQSSRGNFPSSRSFLYTAISGGIGTGLIVLLRQGLKPNYFKNDQGKGEKCAPKGR